MFPDYHTAVAEPGNMIHRCECGVAVVGNYGGKVNLCMECGRVRTFGDWPQCPHGRPELGSFGEDPIEPYFDEHISESGEWITTKAQRRAIMSKNGLDYRKKRTDLLPSGRVYMDMGRR